MRLIHTADLRLDANYADLGYGSDFGERRREALLRILGSVVKRTREWPADALLISGGLFDFRTTRSQTVEAAVEAFDSLGDIPVLIAPGPLDAYAPGSPYAAADWPENVFIFEDTRWRLRCLGPDVVVHGFAHTESNGEFPALGPPEIPGDEATHVALGHALENRLVPPGGGAPLTFDGGILAQPGLSYAAFGGRSEVEVLELEHGVCLGYAGAPDAHGFDERGDHYYLEVVLGQGEPDITAVPSQSVVFEEHEVNCSHLDGVDAVARALRELPRESDTGKSGVETVGRVRLTGESATAWRDCAGEVAEAVCDRFSMLDLIDETAPVLDVSGGEARTSLEAFAQRMSEAFRDAPDGGQRALMRRALQTGLAAFRDEPLPIPGVDEG